MKLDSVEFSERKAVFAVDGVTPSFLNSLRRTLAADVPKLAIEDVTVYDNSSVLFDEIIAHRLGLIPIPTDLAAFTFRAECVCKGEGCPSCTVIYTLSKEGPCTVYSGDLTPTDPKYAVADKKVPIVKLLAGQRLMIEAVAVLGLGHDHAKWVSVVAFGYREYPTVSVKGGKVTLTGSELDELRKLAPADAIVVDDDGKVTVRDPVKGADFLANVRDRYGLDNVQIGHVPGKFLVRFETDGSLTCEDALRKGVEILQGKLKSVEEAAATIK